MKKLIQALVLSLAAVAAAILASTFGMPSGPWGEIFDSAEQPTYVVRVAVEKTISDHGSGTLVRSDLVLTCWHVIRDAKPGNRVFVEFKDGMTRDAQIVKVDRKQDLALLRIEAVIIPAARPAKNPVTKNQEVVICGFPNAKEYDEVSGRVVGTRSPTKDSGDTMFVVSNRADSGMSGGPVFNMEGEVVGVLFGSLRFANCTGLEVIKAFLEDVP